MSKVLDVSVKEELAVDRQEDGFLRVGSAVCPFCDKKVFVSNKTPFGFVYLDDLSRCTHSTEAVNLGFGEIKVKFCEA